CRVHGRDHRPLGAQRRDQDPSHQGAARTAVSGGNAMLDEQVKDLWQTQEAAPPTIPLERVRATAERLDFCARRGKWALWAVMAIELAVLGWKFPSGPLAVQIGSGLIVAGLTFAIWCYYRARLGLPEGIAGSGLEYYRGALVRQRDALRGMWLWFLCPLMPGPALIF